MHGPAAGFHPAQRRAGRGATVWTHRSAAIGAGRWRTVFKPRARRRCDARAGSGNPTVTGGNDTARIAGCGTGRNACANRFFHTRCSGSCHYARVTRVHARCNRDSHSCTGPCSRAATTTAAGYFAAAASTAGRFDTSRNPGAGRRVLDRHSERQQGRLSAQHVEWHPARAGRCGFAAASTGGFAGVAGSGAPPVAERRGLALGR